MSKDIYKKWQKWLICQQNIGTKLNPRPTDFSQNRSNAVDILNIKPMDIILIDWC